MRRLLRALMGAVLLAPGMLPGALRAETLADALAWGYDNSGVIEQNRALLRAADEDVAQAVAALRPIVNWVANVQASRPASIFAENTFANFSASTTIALQGSLTLYDSGNRAMAVDQQKEVVLATRNALLEVEQQVLLRVVQAYMEVRRVSEFVSLRESNVRLITQELRAAQDRFEVGEVTRTDVALAEAALAAARSGLAAEQGNLARAQAEYRAATGQAPGPLALAPPARIPYSLAEARDIALRTHPALLQAQHQVAASEIAVARAETILQPTISATGQFGINQNLDTSTTLGLQLGGPIYQGGGLASQVRQANAQRDATRAGLLTTARNVEQAVANAFASLEVARASRDAFERQVTAAQAAFSGVREEAELGARTTLDVLDAEQDLLDARANLISSEVDETVASYALLSAMGLLTAQNLGLAVQVYDPTAYYNLVDDAPAALSERGEALDRVLQSIGP